MPALVNVVAAVVVTGFLVAILLVLWDLHKHNPRTLDSVPWPALKPSRPDFYDAALDAVTLPDACDALLCYWNPEDGGGRWVVAFRWTVPGRAREMAGILAREAAALLVDADRATEGEG